MRKVLWSRALAHHTGSYLDSHDASLGFGGWCWWSQIVFISTQGTYVCLATMVCLYGYIARPVSIRGVLDAKQHLVFNATFGEVNLSRGGIDPSEGLSLAAGESVHGGQGNVEAFDGEINSQDIDALALVLELPAGSAASRVPTVDDVGAANVGEVGDVALLGPAPAVDDPICSVRAGDSLEGAVGVLVAAVVGNCESCGETPVPTCRVTEIGGRTSDGRGQRTESEEGEDVGGLHLDGWDDEMGVSCERDEECLIQKMPRILCLYFFFFLNDSFFKAGVF